MVKFVPVLAVALLMCMLIGIAFAGGTPMTAKGDRQMVFLFDGLCDMRLMPYFQAHGLPEECYDEYDYDDCWPCGGGLGFRYFLNDDAALRLGANIAIGSWEIKDAWERSCTEFGLSVIYEKYLMHIHSIAPYMGAGVGFAYAKADETWKNTDDEWKWTGTIFSVMGVVGFQWYFTDGMSVGGEYRPAFHFESGEETENGETTYETSGYVLNHRAASLFLGVHF
jgi:hypothetical protein